MVVLLDDDLVVQVTKTMQAHHPDMVEQRMVAGGHGGPRRLSYGGTRMSLWRGGRRDGGETEESRVSGEARVVL